MNSPAPLHVVGIGPGNPAFISPLASSAIEASRLLIGYGLYLDLLGPELKIGKKIASTGMRHEKERCLEAIAGARSGIETALICSGDPGIYALASLVLELLDPADDLPVDIVAGIPAFCAAAARLGAPLTHDFACLSLSDLLTPWARIEKRAHCIFEGDFVCVLYNPRSRHRQEHLEKILEIARLYRDPSCPVGFAQNIGRTGEMTAIYTLASFNPKIADMLSLIFIGNSETRISGKFMLTPRGYKINA